MSYLVGCLVTLMGLGLWAGANISWFKEEPDGYDIHVLGVSTKVISPDKVGIFLTVGAVSTIVWPFAIPVIVAFWIGRKFSK